MIRKCDRCGYTSLTKYEEDYEHKRCGGLMRLIYKEVKDEF